MQFLFSYFIAFTRMFIDSTSLSRFYDFKGLDDFITEDLKNCSRVKIFLDNTCKIK